MNSINTRPGSIDELLDRCYTIAGQTIGSIANKYGQVPQKLLHYKGWFGQLIEMILGADAGSNPTQDFVELGIELKTIPLNHDFYPTETTYVCIAPLVGVHGITYEESNVHNKLSKVLWVPFSGARDIPVSERLVYTPFLWSPDAQEDYLLRTDWNEHLEKIATGLVETITARDGQVLQIRPKAANGKSLTKAIGLNGTVIMTRPRGFYLRKNFTSNIIDRNFGIKRNMVQ